MPSANLSYSSFAGSNPLLHAFVEKGGLATQKSNVFNFPSGFLKYGFDKVLSCQIIAEGVS